MPDVAVAILGMACGLSRSELSPFVGTLRASGYSGAVQLGFDPDRDRAAADFLRANGVTMEAPPCKEQAGARRTKARTSLAQRLGSLTLRRWGWYKQWITERKYERVWLLDVRDVVFQADPFKTLPGDLTLGLFLDRSYLSKGMEDMVGRCVARRAWKSMEAAKAPAVSGGIIAGTAPGILAMCEGMIHLAEDAMKKGQGCYATDQHLVTYFAYQNGYWKAGQKADRMVFPAFDGPAVTVHEAACTEAAKRKGSDGLVVGSNGSALAVLHKWDACKETVRMLKEGTIRSADTGGGAKSSRDPVAALLSAGGGSSSSTGKASGGSLAAGKAGIAGDWLSDPAVLRLQRELRFAPGRVSANSCPKGTVAKPGATACKAAAASLGLRWKAQETTSMWPRGCYQYVGPLMSSADVLFNEHPVGAGKAYARPLCAKVPGEELEDDVKAAAKEAEARAAGFGAASPVAVGSKPAPRKSAKALLRSPGGAAGRDSRKEAEEAEEEVEGAEEPGEEEAAEEPGEEGPSGGDPEDEEAEESQDEGKGRAKKPSPKAGKAAPAGASAAAPLSAQALQSQALDYMEAQQEALAKVVKTGDFSGMAPMLPALGLTGAFLALCLNWCAKSQQRSEPGMAGGDHLETGRPVDNRRYDYEVERRRHDAGAGRPPMAYGYARRPIGNPYVDRPARQLDPSWTWVPDPRYAARPGYDPRVGPQDPGGPPGVRRGR